MSLKKKFLSVFFIFSFILTLVGFNFYQVSLETQKINKNYMQQKESVTSLYQRRDFIKSLLLIDDYQKFMQEEQKLKIIDKELKKTDVFKGVNDLEVLENKILSLHKENLKLNLDFSETYKKEKSTRHVMRDIVYKGENYNETKVLGEVIYNSKEAIFQYRDQKHFDRWQQAIYTLRKVATTSNLIAHTKEYHKISQTISEVLLFQETILAETENSMKTYNNILKMVDSNVRLLESDVNKSIEKTNKNMQKKLIITLLIILFFFIALGIFIHIQLIKPLGILKKSTREISKKNFDHKITLDKNDEIGELANDFNIMVNNLKSRYWNLEEIVKERTKKLQDSNFNLLKEIHKREKIEKVLKNQVMTDELTGLFNRRAAYSFLSDEIKQGHSLTICYLDIDDFKKINDNFGHKEGDRYLKEFSSILKLNLRQEDHIFRVEGDEFIAAFPNKHKEDVEIFFEKRVLIDLRSKLDIEFSYGLLEFSKDKKMSLDEVIKRIDESMYKNKTEKKQRTPLPLNPSFLS
ncbi:MULTISPECIES: GGDEF domain-containing protein [Psychrilyobacter]|uniref:Diguanylate cyclase n=1 Tax=Psychrilyobacter piezotolerans TaxID=2293438 RepID=A0ABX9KI22_9FUSO|nr:MULTISPECIES: GGDEF domain-containing protein [Psychrilyobacter]MCS5421645.1 diguanylate cyclase [Psychrilyobacter sp. S5]NDI77213.1 diguanylate cyclase [Psychrilyobacter piezotolerans]RDE63272.1 diguanylate cyclase [Psychrilyobacter sp. S5]REI41814.1 diguanylate cyclase [Psychrilyobacter piezotolerans]